MDFDAPSPPREPSKRKPAADWLGWSLQWVFGLVVGWFCSFLFTHNGPRSIALVTPQAFPGFSVGVALLAAAAASRKGDRLWLGSSYRVIPPDPLLQSRASVIASTVTGIVGAVLVLIALGRSYGLLS